MADSATLTVRLSSQTKDQLAELANRTRRTRSFLAAEAVTEYVTRELAVVDAIERGRADVRAGRTSLHAEVMDEARAVIRAVMKR